MSYLLRLLLAIDQLLNVAICDGRFWGFMRPVIDTLFWFQPQHCKRAYESELLRLQYTAEFRAVRDIALNIPKDQR